MYISQTYHNQLGFSILLSNGIEIILIKIDSSYSNLAVMYVFYYLNTQYSHAFRFPVQNLERESINGRNILNKNSRRGEEKEKQNTLCTFQRLQEIDGEG